MLLAVISDTHMTQGGARSLPVACLKRLASADAILHAGDLMDEPTLAELEAIGPPIYAIHGNVDDWRVRELLPPTRLVELDGVRIGMIHDAGPAERRLERLRAQFPTANAVVFGHSHIPLHEQRDGFQIFNPGSPTDKRRQPVHTMGMATVANGQIRFEHLELA